MHIEHQNAVACLIHLLKYANELHSLSSTVQQQQESELERWSSKGKSTAQPTQVCYCIYTSIGNHT